MSIKISKLEVSINKKKIIQDLTLEINHGELVGLIAPNGMGKTTLLRSIARLLKINNGNISINEFLPLERVHYLQQFFYLESNNSLYPDLTAKEHLEYVLNTRNSNKSINNIIEQFNMDSYENIRVKKFSLGMKQNLLLAMYVISDAEFLFFDEPFNGLDPGHLKMILDLFPSLIKEGKTIVFSSHNINNIEEICTRALFMNEKKIAIDTQVLDDLSTTYHSLYKQEKTYEYFV